MNLKSQFLLRDDIAFLNHGSFGACPRPVFDRYQEYQLELEREPVEFIIKNGMRYLEQSRIALGTFLNCSPDDVVYVTNPSYAVNLVAKNLELQPGDEILTTDLEYGACDKTWQYYCQQTGATYVRRPVTLPVIDRSQLVNDFVAGITAHTKLIFLSHITSSTALRLPIEEICAAANKQGIPIFIDGAHAPGQIPVDLQALGADLYTGACHKWMMTPKGSSFLYASKAWQEKLDPLIVSWGYNAMFPSKSRFLDYHQMNGTRDYSAFLTIPEAIAFMEQHQWDAVRTACRKMVYENAATLCDILQTSPLAPLRDEFIVQLFSAEIKTTEPEKLHEVLFEKYKIQIPVMRHGDKMFIRYSIQAYNEQSDLDRLFEALKEIRDTRRLIQ